MYLYFREILAFKLYLATKVETSPTSCYSEEGKARRFHTIFKEGHVQKFVLLG